MIMVKAGAPVDAVIGQLAPLLEKGDVIIDGGNSLFTDTQRRCKDLEGKGIHFVGCGVSGGEEGALKGPSLMPGGSRASWEIIAPIFSKIAAQVDGEPCCRYMGPDGAGHYVKMVHNGIEYGDMQLICEAYAILKELLGLDATELADIFTEWNKGELDSYLIEITSQIFRKIDPDTGKAAGRRDSRQSRTKGHRHLDPAIGHRAIGRHLDDQCRGRSAGDFFAQRRARRCLENLAAAQSAKNSRGDAKELIEAVRDALYASKIVSYAQGMELLGAASNQYNWNLNFGDIATIWRGGCIIRAKFLNRIVEAYGRDPALHNLLLDSYFTGIIEKTQAELADGGRDRNPTGRGGAGLQRVAGLLRQLSFGAVAIESAAGAARFLRRAHLRAHRQAGCLSHRMAGVGRQAERKTGRAERTGETSRRE